MTTKIFISWSGELSREIGEAIRDWLPKVLQFAKPYFTPSDIEKGAKWSSDIIYELESSEIGILCLTKENLSEPWILFEAGALSKNFENSKVCPLLFEVELSDLKGPLTSFQAARFNKKEFQELIATINNEGGDSKLEKYILDQVFDKWWDELQSTLEAILKNYKSKSEIPHRPEREILEEILELTRINSRDNSPKREVSKKLTIFIETIISTFFSFQEKFSTNTFMLMHMLRGPVEELSKELNEPIIYKRFLEKFGNQLDPSFTNNIEDQESSPEPTND